jgi:TonB family protein
MRRILSTVLLLAAAPLARAEEATGVLTKAPAVVAPAEPEYPQEAREAGLGAEVTLEIEISETGDVEDAVVTAPAGHGFDEAAVAAARKLRFSPAEIDGKPARVRIEYRFTFALAPPPAPAPPPPVNLRGVVLERGTRLPIVAALVEAGGRSTYTDRNGRFELAGVPEGNVKVTVSDAAHARYEADEVIFPGKATEVKYWLRRTRLGEYEAVIVGTREEREVAHVAISSGEIRRVPGVSGDTVKVIQNLPGVARAPGDMGQLIVRGGNARDTRVYVDGREVPLVFHFGGLTSVYSSDLVKDVEFEAGNFGVRYGRAIGGRVNLVTRDPGERTHALVDANLYHATALVESQPREDLGVAFAARRSYADAVVTAAVDQMEDGPTFVVAPRYYDFQAKIAWKASPDDTLRLDVLGSDDRMLMTGIPSDGLVDMDRFEFSTGFNQAALRWERRLSDDARLHVSLAGGTIDTKLQFSDLFTDHERGWNTTLRAELHRSFGERLRIVTGADGSWYPQTRVDVLAPSLPLPGQVPSPFPEPQRYHETVNGAEAGAFVEATVQPIPKLYVVPGVRGDLHRSDLASLSWVDPRLAMRWEMRQGTALKGAVGLYHQAPPLPYLTEEWGNPDMIEEGAWQYSVGAEHRILPRLSADVQLYYKRLFQLAQPSDRIVERDGSLVPERFASDGGGKAYGAEVLVRWDPGGRFFGWLAYSLSRAKRDKQDSGMQMEEEADAYDQPHNVVAVGTWELPEVWNGLSAGFRARYTTGNPYEPIRGAVYDADADAYQPLTTGRTDDRMPDFFQLDVRVDKKWTQRAWTFAAYLELQNATNRGNPEGPAYNYDYTNSGWVTGLPIFPAFGLRAEY